MSKDNNPTQLLHLPYGFARAVLGVELYGWQQDILAAMDQRGAAVAVKAANGSGKTTTVGVPLALWHAAVFPGSLVIATAGVFRQVKEQFFPGIRRFQHLFPEWNFLETEVETPSGSRIYGFSTDDPGRFEGWHNENLLVLCDEAKSIPDAIFEAIERCQPCRRLLMSSPGRRQGRFYEAFTSRRSFYRQFSVPAQQCSHIPEKWIQDQIAQYGSDSPLVRSMIHAEFPGTETENVVIPLSDLEKCLATPPTVEAGETHAFCDFAAGGDENVLAIRRGNRIEIVKAWRERDTMAAVGEFVRLFRQAGLQPKQISADASGLGLPMCDRFREVGWDLHRIRNEKQATKPEAYMNLGAEIWFEGARKIQTQDIALPQDRLLHQQLVARRYSVNSRGQLQLEPKEHLQARGLPSPDRADAALGAIYQPRRSKLLYA